MSVSTKYETTSWVDLWLEEIKNDPEFAFDRQKTGTFFERLLAAGYQLGFVEGLKLGNSPSASKTITITGDNETSLVGYWIDYTKSNK